MLPESADWEQARLVGGHFLLTFAIFLMDFSMAGFAAYHLVNAETGIALYQTVATEAEILKANTNLKCQGLTAQFIRADNRSTLQVQPA